MKLESSRFPVAEDNYLHMLSVPIYPALKKEEAERVAQSAR
jgi:dTDP-4-amino-4,6-dideoxygalactose transaminase